MSKPISIIIPCYNDEKYIEQCLNSVVKQEDADKLLEVIVINDGSTDRSQQIIDTFVERYPFVQGYYQENAGLSSARNSGIEYSRGKYCYFLDSDDYLELDAMKKIYMVAEKFHCDMVTFNTRSFGDKFADIWQYVRTLEPDSIYTGSEYLHYVCEHKEFYVPVWLYFYNRNFIINNKLFFINGIIHEDVPFTLDAVVAARHILYINKQFHWRRIRKNSIMTSSCNVNNIASTEYVMMHIYDYYQNNNYIKMKKDMFNFLRPIVATQLTRILTCDRNDKTRNLQTYRDIRKKYVLFLLKNSEFLSIMMLKNSVNVFRRHIKMLLQRKIE